MKISEVLIIKNKSEVLYLQLHDILYIQADGNYSNINLADGGVINTLTYQRAEIDRPALEARVPRFVKVFIARFDDDVGKERQLILRRDVECLGRRVNRLELFRLVLVPEPRGGVVVDPLPLFSSAHAKLASPNHKVRNDRKNKTILFILCTI